MSASASLPALDVPGTEAYTQSIRPAFGFVVIASAFSAVLVPLLVILFALSTRKSRRTPMFILNVISILLGILTGILCVHLAIQVIFSPLSSTNRTEDFLFNLLSVWMPWITECILLLRVFAIFKPTNFVRMAALLAFPVTIKTIRAVLNIVFLAGWKPISNANRLANQFNVDWVLQVSWILELVDNAFISFLFLWRLGSHSSTFKGKMLGRVNARSESTSFSSKLQTLFWIASTNFMFPLVFGLCQVILLYVPDKEVIAANIKVVNVYISIVSTVFATIWASTKSIAIQSNSDIHRSTVDRRQETGVVIEITTLTEQRKESWPGVSSK